MVQKCCWRVWLHIWCNGYNHRFIKTGARLQMEMAELERRILQNEDLRESDLTKTHADWAEKWLPNYEITEGNLHAIVQKEIGFVFAKVMECAGVYKRTPEGQAAFKKFLECI